MKQVVVRCALVSLLALGLATTAAQEPDGRAHHAAVVVQYASGQVAARCVGFDEESISGYDALVLAGFNVVAEGSAGVGAMVCSIDGVGCDFPTESCACKCEGGACSYWSYSHLRDGVWQYSSLGASSYRVRDGAVEGWAWGAGSVQQGASPPVVSWGDICAAQAAPLPTAIPPTAIPPTEPPPTRIPATAAPSKAPPAAPTRVPPTLSPAPATEAPDSEPTPAPATPTGSLPTATRPPTTGNLPTAIRPRPATPTGSPAPTASVAAASPAAARPDPSPTALAAGVAPAPRRPGPTASGWISYVAFGAIAAGLGASVLFMRRRRAR